MKDGLRQVVGRQIAAVIVAANEKSAPRRQVFLVFTDGTSLELYGESFTCCAGVDPAEHIERYVRAAGGRIERVYIEPTCTRAPETLVELVTRDLGAWQAAKDAIARARRH